LMVSENLLAMRGPTRTTVTDREAIAIDQDPAGVQARLLAANGSGQVWVKPLTGGRRAVALLNRSSGSVEIQTTATAVGAPQARVWQVRNVWTGAVGDTSGSIAANVPAYSTVLLIVSPAARSVRPSPRRHG
jgi:alpha-galactosidase